MNYEKYCQSADYIREMLPTAPGETAVVLGSGLGGLVDAMDVSARISYSDIPHFPSTSAQGHEGAMYFGTLSGKNIIALRGRAHFYEGHTFSQAAYYVRVLKLLGVKNLIITNAAGGINESFEPGELMLIDDHIKFFDDSPVRGKNIDEFGTRFFDMSAPYNAKLSELAKGAAYELGIGLRQGVYAFMPGPGYETRAEIRALRVLGADAVGMSTVPEVIAATHAGMRVLGISCITNMAAGVSKEALNHDEVLETGERAKTKFSALVSGIIAKI